MQFSRKSLGPRTAKRASAGALLLVVALASPTLARPATQDRPAIAPEALQQIAALQAAQAARTPTQQKIDSNLLRAAQQRAPATAAAAAATKLRIAGVEIDAQSTTVIDLRADVNDALLARVRALGGTVSYHDAALRTVVARVPLGAIEALAALPQVHFVVPHRTGQTAGERDAMRAERVREQLSLLAQAPNQEPTPPRNAEPQLAGPFIRHLPLITTAPAPSPTPTPRPTPSPTPSPTPPPHGGNYSQGDLTHRAAQARAAFGVNGAGVTIGVLSDGVETLARAQARGDLPGNVIVLPGQSGTEPAGIQDEGTAMLEIVHDLAPGAQLMFATGFRSIEEFATNIRALRAAGADIIVDDIGYFVETPFQLGQAPGVLAQYNGGVVSQAVNDVVADGAIYFSSAGNSGNLNDGTSGVWEGTFTSGGATAAPLPTGSTVHDFVPGAGVQTFNRINEDTSSLSLLLHWADPLGASNNDYDLYLLDANGTEVIGASDNLQNGRQDPVEGLVGDAGFNLRGARIVVVKYAPDDQPRYLHLNTNRGRLEFGTDGQTYGHPAVPAAIGVAATPAGAGDTTVRGPFPGAFNPTNVVERFSSDGPRQFFFYENGTPINNGAGFHVLKPDLTAADGVSTQADPQEAFNPFFGTSAAAPHAAAIAALVQQANPSLGSDMVERVLINTTIDIEAPGTDRDSGYGIVDAYKAVQTARALTPTTLQALPSRPQRSLLEQ